MPKTVADPDVVKQLLDGGATIKQVAAELGIAASTIYGIRKRHGIAPPDRFWSHVAIGDSTECWLWTGECWPLGYGLFVVNPRSRTRTGAHRHAWTLMRGKIRAGAVVRHHCENLACCNPEHLFLAPRGRPRRRGRR